MTEILFNGDDVLYTTDIDLTKFLSLNHINCMLYHFLLSSKLEHLYCPSVFYTSGVCSNYNYKNSTFVTPLA